MNQQHDHEEEQPQYSELLSKPMKRQIRLPCSFTHYIHLVSVWRTLTESERDSCLMIDKNLVELIAMTTAAEEQIHQAEHFAHLLQMYQSTIANQPFQTYTQKLFASVFSTPRVEYAVTPHGASVTPSFTLPNEDGQRRALRLSLVAQKPTFFPSDISVPLSTDFFVKSVILPPTPDWLLTLSRKQDEIFAEQPMRPWVHELEREFLALPNLYFTVTFTMCMAFFVNLDRYAWHKTQKSELMSYLKSLSDSSVNLSKWLAFYNSPPSDAAAIAATKDAAAATTTTATTTTSSSMTVPSAEEKKLLHLNADTDRLLDNLCQATAQLTMSETLIPLHVNEFVESLPNKSWSDADRGREYTGTRFMRFNDLLMGRAAAPNVEALTKQAQMFLENYKRHQLMAAAYGHGSHGHSHGNGQQCNHDHGHNHGAPAAANASHGHSHKPGQACNHDHGHSHAAPAAAAANNNSHGHSHKPGQACNHDHGHSHAAPAAAAANNNSHGHSHKPGQACNHDHGHSHSQNNQHNHSHGADGSCGDESDNRVYVCGRAGCNVTTNQLKRCARCGTPYCSRECQVTDWKQQGHKVLCEKIAQARAAKDASE